MHDRRKDSGNSSEPPVVLAPTNNHNPILLTREAVAARWSVSLRTLDRLRQDGLIPWVDLRSGRGAKPIVRFCLEDIEDYEQRGRMDCGRVDC
jgi:hypothetical protein